GLGREAVGRAVEVGVVADAGEGVLGGVEEVDVRGAAGSSVEAESAVGAEYVEHAATPRERAHGEAVEPLVDEEARLRAAEHVHFELHAGLLDPYRPRDLAPEDARGLLQPVLLAQR